jgi:hypothetical protein
MSTVLQLVGLGAVVAGAALIAPAAGLIVGGVLLALVGVALEPRGK